MRAPRKTTRREGLTEAEARRLLSCRVRPAVVLPDGRVIDDRRERPRRRDESEPVWIPAFSARMRLRFPDGARVVGPFRVTGHGVWRDGEGVVSWVYADLWAVPESAVPVRVEIGNRYSGGYFPEELTIIGGETAPIDLDGLDLSEPDPYPEPEPRREPVAVGRPCVACRKPARIGRACDACRGIEPEPEEEPDDELVLDDEILEILQDAGFTP